MLRVGQIPYLNLEPFHFGLSAVAGPGVELHPLPPRALGLLAAEGGLDAGAFSLMDSVRLEDRFEPLGDFCLACSGQVRSVLFFARRPIEEMAGATVAVTGETATSVVLLKLLLARRYGLRDVRYVDLAVGDPATTPAAILSLSKEAAGLGPPKGQAVDGCLLIGDGALRHRHGIEGLAHRYDLAEEWAAWQGLPFIFARWMVRTVADEHEKAALREALAQRLRANLACLDAIGRVRRDLGMTVSEIKTYLEGFTFELGERERRGMETFLRLARSLAAEEGPAHADGG
jgi:chorismate dehydratase